MTRRVLLGRFIAAAAASGVLVAGVWLPGGHRSDAVAGRYRSHSERIARGVTLWHVVDARGPNRIKVLEVDPRRVTIDVGLAKNTLPGLETTAAIARRHRATAAINGDYFLTHGHEWMGRPVNTFAEDADLKASPMIWGRNFALSRRDARAVMGHYRLRVRLTQHDNSQMFSVADWNEGGPRSRRFAGFTPDGGSAITPPHDSCSVRLYPSAQPRWHPESREVQQELTVDTARCGTEPLRRRGGIVVAGQIDADGLLLTQSLTPGEGVRLSWSLGLPGVVETLGGNPLLIDDGRLAASCDGASFCRRHPRTGIGVTEDGTLLLVTVDGRWPKRSVGMTPEQFARLFRYLGAVEAINLDGGGSTTMVVRGKTVNRPSDGHQRKVANALLVLTATDPGEPAPAASPLPTPTPQPSLAPTPSPTPSPSGSGPSPPQLESNSARTSACLSALDPASSGGYLSALLAGTFGRIPTERPAPVMTTRAIFLGRLRCEGVASTYILRRVLR